MFSKKLTPSERIRLREQRQETRLINRLAKERRFEYVVNPPKMPKVVFGSSLPRETLPRSGPCLSSFMRSIQGEIRPFPGPFEYDVLKPSKREKNSRLGFSSFASKLPQITPTSVSNYPPLGSYDIEEGTRVFKESKAPFGSRVPRARPTGFAAPGPATYPIHVSRPKLQICNAFGSRLKYWPSVAVICTPQNVAKCHVCGQATIGDYWHQWHANLDMCRKCMNEKIDYLRQCTTDLFVRNHLRDELTQYAPVRYCDIYHLHNGTTAAVTLHTRKQYLYRVNKENYLSLYLKKFPF